MHIFQKIEEEGKRPILFNDIRNYPDTKTKQREHEKGKLPIEITHENLTYSPLWYSVTRWRDEVGREVGGVEFKSEGTHVCLWLIHVDVWRNHHNII